jgi:hypothetical protein
MSCSFIHISNGRYIIMFICSFSCRLTRFIKFELILYYLSYKSTGDYKKHNETLVYYESCKDMVLKTV